MSSEIALSKYLLIKAGNAASWYDLLSLFQLNVGELVRHVEWQRPHLVHINDMWIVKSHVDTYMRMHTHTP